MLPVGRHWAARVVVWGRGVAQDVFKVGVDGAVYWLHGVTQRILFAFVRVPQQPNSQPPFLGTPSPPMGATGSPDGACMCDCLHELFPTRCRGAVPRFGEGVRGD